MSNATREGPARPEIDAGLKEAMKHAQPGVPMTLREIARYCGCSPMNIGLIERRARKKLLLRMKALHDALES